MVTELTLDLYIHTTHLPDSDNSHSTHITSHNNLSFCNNHSFEVQYKHDIIHAHGARGGIIGGEAV